MTEPIAAEKPLIGGPFPTIRFHPEVQSCSRAVRVDRY